MSLKIDINAKEPGVFSVELDGSLDTNTYMSLEDEITPLLIPSTQVVIFDMTDVNYVSSMGIGVVLKAKKAMQNNHGSLLVVNLQPQVKKVFDIIKALPAEAIFTSIEEADAYLDAIQKREIDKERKGTS